MGACAVPEDRFRAASSFSPTLHPKSFPSPSVASLRHWPRRKATGKDGRKEGKEICMNVKAPENPALGWSPHLPTCDMTGSGTPSWPSLLVK